MIKFMSKSSKVKKWIKWRKVKGPSYTPPKLKTILPESERKKSFLDRFTRNQKIFLGICLFFSGPFFCILSLYFGNIYAFFFFLAYFACCSFYVAGKWEGY